MPLIQKEGYLHDPETGLNYASSESVFPPHRRKKNYRGAAFWDTLFGLYVEYSDGEKLTLLSIAKQMKVPVSSIYNHAKQFGWREKAEIIIRKRNGASQKALTVTPAAMVASTMAEGQVEFRENVNDLLVRASQTVRKMNPKTYLDKKTKEVREMVNTMQTVNPWSSDDGKQPGAAPVLNVAFLMSEGAKPVVVVSPAED